MIGMLCAAFTDSACVSHPRLPQENTKDRGT